MLLVDVSSSNIKCSLENVFPAKVCPYTSVGKAAVQRHFLKVHHDTTHEAKSAKLMSKKISRERWVVKEEDTFVTHYDTFESDTNNEELDTKEVNEPQVKRQRFLGQMAKTEMGNDSRAVKKLYKCWMCDHASSRRTSLAQHVKRVHKECENYEETDNDGGVSKVEIKEHERAPLAQFNSGKVRTEDARPTDQHLDAKQHAEVEGVEAKTASMSDSRAKKKLYKREKCDQASSRRNSLVQHVKRGHEDCENFEERDNYDKVSKAEIREHKRAPLAQFNKWPPGKVASVGLPNNCAIQISLESLGLLQGIAPSQAPKCL